MTVPVHPERPRPVVPCGCVLGEGPVWDSRDDVLHWVDIEGRELWSWRPAGAGEARRRPLPEKAGFVVLTPDPGTVLLGLASGLARLALRGGGEPETVLRPEPDLPGNRLNDADVGPDGSLYLGSMNDGTGPREPTGSFYRWSPAGLDRFGGHAVVTNGPCIDPARGLLYATDTSDGVVYRHRLAPDGAPGPAEVFVRFRSGDGHPDGMAVDAESHLWVCHFGGGRVTRFTPEGEPALLVPMPTGQVTKLAFGGEGLRTAFVTTAARGRDRETDPLAGHLFSFEPGVAGIPAEPCRMAGG